MKGDVMKFSDSVIGRIAQIVQEGMLLGVDVVDLMRQVEVEPVNNIDGEPELELTPAYSQMVREHHNKLLREAEELKAENAQTQNVFVEV